MVEPVSTTPPATATTPGLGATVPPAKLTVLDPALRVRPALSTTAWLNVIGLSIVVRLPATRCHGSEVHITAGAGAVVDDGDRTGGHALQGNRTAIAIGQAGAVTQL